MSADIGQTEDGKPLAPNSKAARRLKAGVPPEHREPREIILSVALDNGDFEASVRVPLTMHPNFDAYAARWLALMHTALQHGVESMGASLTPASPDKGRAE